MWVFYISYNVKDTPDIQEYYATKQQAEARLVEEPKEQVAH